MRPSFQARLINGPFDDPGLIVHCSHQKRVLLFDLGDLGALSPNDVLKVTHIFVTHTHVDHFIGFDQVLRLLLGREKVIRLYGPEGFLKNVAGKLAGYSWNLVHNYHDALTIEAAEVADGQVRIQTFDCQTGFVASPIHEQPTPDGVLLQEPILKVETVVLDHQIPCLAFNLEERFHVNILKPRLDALGLTVGPWLTDFKRRLLRGDNPATMLRIPSPFTAASQPQDFSLGDLQQEITRITRGQKIAYVTDAAYHRSNEEKIVALAQGADHLFIEAAFLDAERKVALAKHHLTARQAGLIGHKAGVRQMTVFHYSPRYTGKAEALENEARQAFEYGR